MVEKSLIDPIGNLLKRKEQTIAVAESVTAGLLQLSLSTAADASLFFQGGITVFNLGQKYHHLNVEPIHAQQCNCVSAKVAAQMAINVCTLFNSDWGIGITGYASVVPESEGKLFCYYAIANNKKILAHAKLNATTSEGLETQKYYAQKTFEKLKHVLNKK